jgi:hypothetical protein
MCECNIGYGGEDCSTSKQSYTILEHFMNTINNGLNNYTEYCPKAFDPISLPKFENRRRTIRLKFSVKKGQLDGSFEFHLGPSFGYHRHIYYNIYLHQYIF